LLIDPRAAIHELASVLVGDTRDAYTLAFAPYFTTQGLPGASAASGYAAAALASPFCDGFTSVASRWSQWSLFGQRAAYAYAGGGAFLDGASVPFGFGGGCVVPTLGWGFANLGYPFGVVPPFRVPAPTRPFTLPPRVPFTPKPWVHTQPPRAPAARSAAAMQQDRRRGLAATDDPARSGARRGAMSSQARPGIDAASPTSPRPTIGQSFEAHHLSASPTAQHASAFGTTTQGTASRPMAASTAASASKPPGK
jgi:hypothetical protein